MKENKYYGCIFIFLYTLEMLQKTEYITFKIKKNKTTKKTNIIKRNQQNFLYVKLDCDPLTFVIPINSILDYYIDLSEIKKPK